MARQIDELRKEIARLKGKCLESEERISEEKIKDQILKPYNPGRLDIGGYNLQDKKIDDPECFWLVLPEVPMTKLLFQMQSIQNGH